MPPSKKQPRFTNKPEESGVFTRFYKQDMELLLSEVLGKEPQYKADSRTRDKWLSSIWMANPMVAGVVSSMIERDKNRGWSLTGAYSTVKNTKEILHSADAGAGWREHVGQLAAEYYTTDMGALEQYYRTNPDGQPANVSIKEGKPVADYPVSALFTYDAVRCRLTNDWKMPIEYFPMKSFGGSQESEKIALGQVGRFASMRSFREELNGLGFCFMSRVVQVLRQLVMTFGHYDEMLSSRVAAGFVTVTGISQAQFEEALGGHNEALERLGRKFFGGVMVLANDGGKEVVVKYTPVSQLPEGFDPSGYYEIMMMAMSLAAGYPVTEFWEVGTGRGFGREGENRDASQRAGGKGRNGFAIAHQEQLQMPGVLPARVYFEYDRHDAGERLMQAQVVGAWLQQVGLPMIQMNFGIQNTARFLVEQGVLPSWITTEKENASASDSDAYVEPPGGGEENPNAITDSVSPNESGVTETVANVNRTRIALSKEIKGMEDLRIVRQRLLDDPEFHDRLDASENTNEPIVHYRNSVGDSGFGVSRMDILWDSASEARKRKSFQTATAKK